MKNYLITLSVSLLVIGGLIAGCQQTGEIPEVLKIVDRSPALNATGVSVSAPLSITFNFPIYNNGITKENLFSDYLQFGPEHTAGNPTITSLNWSADQKTLTINVSGWSGGSASVVHIVPRADKIKDIFDNPISVDLWKYTFGETFPTTTTTSTTITTSSTSTSTTTTTTTTTLPDFSWTQKTGSAAFAARDSHTSVVFNNKMWVIGGYTASSGTNDVWSSIDGDTWVLATPEATFPPIYEHTSVVFDNKMWVIGGQIPGTYTNEVWSSGDGVTWTVVTPEAAFAKRNEHASVVFDNKMWVIGGGQPYMSDVWYSSDGKIWTCATTNAAFGKLANHSATVLDGNMWVVGGRDETIFDDVWYSSDGISWNKAGTISAFGILTSESETARMAHTAVTYNFNGDDKMFITGGYNSWNLISNYLNDLWYTDNGASWTEAPVSTTYPGRDQHTSVVFDNKIWVIGGYDNVGPRLNDVWYSPLP